MVDGGRYQWGIVLHCIILLDCMSRSSGRRRNSDSESAGIEIDR